MSKKSTQEAKIINKQGNFVGPFFSSEVLHRLFFVGSAFFWFCIGFFCNWMLQLLLMMIPIGLYCFQRFQNIYSDIYLRVLSSTRPYQALTIKDKNKQNDLSDKTFTFLQRISSLFPFQKCLATGHNPEDEDVFQLDESSPPRITPVASQILLQTLCLRAFTKLLPKAPAHLQPPPGSTCC